MTIADNFSHVSPFIEVGASLTGRRVVAVLERLQASHGLPAVITVDLGSEFTARALDEWAHRRGVRLDFTRRGKPTDNTSIESFKGKLRLECLNKNWFATMDDAKAKIEACRLGYNRERPHSSLGNRAPESFAREWAPPEPMLPTAIGRGA